MERLLLNPAVGTASLGVNAFIFYLNGGTRYHLLQEAERNLLPAFYIQMGVEAIHRFYSMVESPSIQNDRKILLGMGALYLVTPTFFYSLRSLVFPASIACATHLVHRHLFKQREEEPEERRMLPADGLEVRVAPAPLEPVRVEESTQTETDGPAAPAESVVAEHPVDEAVKAFRQGPRTPESLLEIFSRFQVMLNEKSYPPECTSYLYRRLELAYLFSGIGMDPVIALFDRAFSSDPSIAHFLYDSPETLWLLSSTRSPWSYRYPISKLGVGPIVRFLFVCKEQIGELQKRPKSGTIGAKKEAYSVAFEAATSGLALACRSNLQATQALSACIEVVSEVRNIGAERLAKVPGFDTCLMETLSSKLISNFIGSDGTLEVAQLAVLRDQVEKTPNLTALEKELFLSKLKEIEELNREGLLEAARWALEWPATV